MSFHHWQVFNFREILLEWKSMSAYVWCLVDCDFEVVVALFAFKDFCY